MQLEIKNNTLLREIQVWFNEVYPYLWIDFYYRVNSEVNHSRLEKIQPGTPLKNLCNLKDSTLININGNRSVADLERDFCESLGLKVKVLRKSGNVWVGTGYTGNWTLENQNFQGEQIVMD